MSNECTIVVVGDEHTGKTSLICSLISESFRGNQIPPVLKPVIVPAELQPSQPLTIIDTSSNPANIDETTFQISRADAVVLVCAQDCPDSFPRIRSCWLPLIRKSNPSAPVVIAINKSGVLQDSHEQQNARLCHQMVRDMQAEVAVECSAKDLLNVSDVFYHAQRSSNCPIRPLYNPATRELTERYMQALTHIFRILDRDLDSLLSDEELCAFQEACFLRKIRPAKLKQLKQMLRDAQSNRVAYVVDDGKGAKITFAGFVCLNRFFVERLPRRLDTAWLVLSRFGYGTDLELRPEVYSLPEREPTQTCELTLEGFDFLTTLFHRYDRDGNGGLSYAASSPATPSEIDELFAPCSGVGWGPGCVEFTSTLKDVKRRRQEQEERLKAEQEGMQREQREMVENRKQVQSEEEEQQQRRRRQQHGQNQNQNQDEEKQGKDKDGALAPVELLTEEKQQQQEQQQQQGLEEEHKRQEESDSGDENINISSGSIDSIDKGSNVSVEQVEGDNKDGCNTEDRELSLRGWLSQWSMLALFNPEKVLQQLAVLGFQGERVGVPEELPGTIKVNPLSPHGGGDQSADGGGWAAQRNRNAISCLLIGAARSGKTSLCRALTHKPFLATTPATDKPQTYANWVPDNVPPESHRRPLPVSLACSPPEPRRMERARRWLMGDADTNKSNSKSNAVPVQQQAPQPATTVVSQDSPHLRLRREDMDFAKSGHRFMMMTEVPEAAAPGVLDPNSGNLTRCDLVCLVYDGTDPESMKVALSFLSQLPDAVPRVMLQTKADLPEHPEVREQRLLLQKGSTTCVQRVSCTHDADDVFFGRLFQAALSHAFYSPAGLAARGNMVDKRAALAIGSAVAVVFALFFVAKTRSTSLNRVLRSAGR